MNVEPCEENKDISDQLVKSLQSDNKIKEISLKFASFGSIAEKISFVGELLHSYEKLPKFIQDGKSDEKAKEILIKGNAFFCSARDEKALEMYNCTIALAEDKSETLAKAYANRSAIFYRANMYDECIQDIQRALENNYPKSLEKKLEDRRSKAETLKAKQTKVVHHQSIPTIPLNRRNKSIECASDSVEIRQLETMGRCVFATKNISVGEVIAVEKPAFSILTDRKWCHCHHCLRLCYNLIPCTKCTQALFCSDNCEESARIYHDFECAISATISTFDMNSCRFLPLRIALMMTKDSSWLKPEENSKIYRSGRYKEIHDLVTNMNYRPVTNLFERATTVALFHYLLKQYTEFFNGEDEKYEETFKELVMKNLMIMACNFHEITELERSYHTGVFELQQIGSGGYSFLSLLNHSCISNVTRISYGDKLVLVAIQSIKKGEQLFDNYGYHYSINPKSYRQEGLKKQYFMECTCEACTYDYRMYLDFPAHGKGMKLFWKYYHEMATADLITARRIKGELEEVLMHLEEDIPCANHCAIQELVKQCYKSFGNIRRELITKK